MSDLEICFDFYVDFELGGFSLVKPPVIGIESFHNSMLMCKELANVLFLTIIFNLSDAWETGIQRDPMMDSDGEDADMTCKLDYGNKADLFFLL